MFDLLIQNAMIYDGTGNPAYKGDVAVKDGKIVAIGFGLGEAKEVVDAKGLALSPGFIDAHSHADATLFHYPQRNHVLEMGVTTEITGMCGVSLSPTVENYDKAFLDRYNSTSAFHTRYFSRTKDQLDAMDQLSLGPNQALFVGHGLLRLSVMGTEMREPTDEEMKKMQSMLAQAMEDGAFGLTTGLSYVPGIYSNSKELIELSKAMAPYGGIYSSHSRSESAGLFKSVQECIDIAREAKVSVNISHFKMVGKTFWPRCDEALKMIEDANEQGLDVTVDCYPYCAVSTTTTSAIPARFLTSENGGFVKRLENPEIVEEIRKEIYEIDDPSWDNSALHVGLENFLIVGADCTPEVVGKTYAQVGEEWGVSGFDAMIELFRRNDGKLRDVRFAMKEENVEKILAHPLCVVGSDGTYTHGRDKMTHPRAIGSFPRFLGHYVREKGILSREEGVRRCTGKTADRYGLEGKGYIKVGYDADLVLFDYDTIIDRADFYKPFQHNEGIHKVIVNGVTVVEDNIANGNYAGKAIRRKIAK